VQTSSVVLGRENFVVPFLILKKRFLLSGFKVTTLSKREQISTFLGIEILLIHGFVEKDFKL